MTKSSGSRYYRHYHSLVIDLSVYDCFLHHFLAKSIHFCKFQCGEILHDLELQVFLSDMKNGDEVFPDHHSFYFVPIHQVFFIITRHLHSFFSNKDHRFMKDLSFIKDQYHAKKAEQESNHHFKCGSFAEQ